MKDLIEITDKNNKTYSRSFHNASPFGDKMSCMAIRFPPDPSVANGIFLQITLYHTDIPLSIVSLFFKEIRQGAFEDVECDAIGIRRWRSSRREHSFGASVMPDGSFSCLFGTFLSKKAGKN